MRVNPSNSDKVTTSTPTSVTNGEQEENQLSSRVPGRSLRFAVVFSVRSSGHSCVKIVAAFLVCN